MSFVNEKFEEVGVETDSVFIDKLGIRGTGISVSEEDGEVWVAFKATWTEKG